MTLWKQCLYFFFCVVSTVNVNTCLSSVNAALRPKTCMTDGKHGKRRYWLINTDMNQVFMLKGRSYDDCLSTFSYRWCWTSLTLRLQATNWPRFVIAVSCLLTWSTLTAFSQITMGLDTQISTLWLDCPFSFAVKIHQHLIYLSCTV